MHRTESGRSSGPSKRRCGGGHSERPDASASWSRFALDTFIENTSLRGFRKCRTNKHRLLRLHWLLYLLSMTAILVYGTYQLLSEYLEYHTSYQVEESANDPTYFPSLTVCSVYPFNPGVARLWSSGQLISPSDVSRMLRRAMGGYVQWGRYTEAGTLFHSDKVSTYFQLLNQTELSRVEHSLDDLMPICNMRHSLNANPSVAHTEPCLFHVRRIHHPDYFTCYSLQLPQNLSSRVSDVSLVLSNVHFQDHESQSYQVLSRQPKPVEEHVYNVFTQGAGFLIVLHQPDTYPQLEEDSFSVQMQTSTVIRYRAMKFVKDNTRSNECADAVPEGAVQDVNETFAYTKTACISGFIGRQILKHCGCVSAFHLRPRLPGTDMPYCGYYNPAEPQKFVDRLNCVRGLNLTKLMSGVIRRHCPKRCQQQAYESHLSSSNWEPSMCQFYWLDHVTRALGHLQRNPTHSAARQELIKFSQLDSVLVSPELNQTKLDEDRALKNMALVTVSRLNYRTVISREKLQISLSALWSRLGGLGSLTIGITVTFAFELAELLYLMAYRVWVRFGWQQQDDSKPLPGRTADAFTLTTWSDDEQPTTSNGIEDQRTRQRSFYDNVPTKLTMVNLALDDIPSSRRKSDFVNT